MKENIEWGTGYWHQNLLCVNKISQSDDGVYIQGIILDRLQDKAFFGISRIEIKMNIDKNI